MPKPDLIVVDQGSIFLLRGATDAGEEWIVEHIPAEAQRWCGDIVVEHRYIGAIIDGAMNDGLEIA